MHDIFCKDFAIKDILFSINLPLPEGSCGAYVELSIVKAVVNNYHLIRTAVFSSFKPPSPQSEAGSTSANTTSSAQLYFPILNHPAHKAKQVVPARMCHGKYFVLKSRQQLNKKIFQLKIHLHRYMPRWHPSKGKTLKKIWKNNL